MTPLVALRRVRVILTIGVLARAVAWGLVAAASMLLAAVLVDWIAPLALHVRELLLALGAAAAVCVAVATAVRDRAVMSARDVALWLEARVPALGFRLVSAVEMRESGLADGVNVGQWTALAFRRVGRALGIPVLLLAIAAAVLLALPSGAVARIRAPHAGDSLERVNTRASAASRLEPLVAEITPPGYAHTPVERIDDPSTVRALVGSTIVLRGRGDAAGIFAHIGGDSIPAAAGAGGTWSITTREESRPTAARLIDRDHERIIALEPVADAPPTVELVSPAHDTVLRAPHGRIPLSTQIQDDIGLEGGWFELIVSSGEGETFKFRTSTLYRTYVHWKSLAINGVLTLDSLHLSPGDVLHVRAVARDANVVSGPGIGYSETRTIRIARPGDYDSVAVDATAPTDEDKSMVSERMLIMLTEALERARPKLARDSLVHESQSIATDQNRLRRSVADVVFSRLGGEPAGEERSGPDSPARARSMEDLLARADSATSRATEPTDFGGDETPVVAVNTPLLEAYTAMWDAGSALEIGEPARALPHMRRALAAIERARQAERIYLHGAAPQIVVDVARARLQGKEKGASSAHRAARSADSAAVQREERFARAAALLNRSPAAALDSILLLRIDALSSAPAFAAALGDATDALRREDRIAASVALAHARRALVGTAVVRDSLSRWGIVP